MFQSTPPRGGRPITDNAEDRLDLVSIHAPRAGGDTSSGLSAPACDICFNPRPPRGGRLHCGCIRHAESVFQSTPPRGGRRCSGCRSLQRSKFQSTPPRGGRPSAWMPTVADGFNPRPRAGGDMSPTAVSQVCVSIHAPARGATTQRGRWHEQRCFNPRPRAGGDKSVAGTLYRPCFNPRPPRGGRLVETRWRIVRVSIHAPARGATAAG